MLAYYLVIRPIYHCIIAYVTQRVVSFRLRQKSHEVGLVYIQA